VLCHLEIVYVFVTQVLSFGNCSCICYISAVIVNLKNVYAFVNKAIVYVFVTPVLCHLEIVYVFVTQVLSFLEIVYAFVTYKQCCDCKLKMFMHLLHKCL
jgi:hypothetical protein